MTASDKIITTVRQYCLDLFQNGMSTQQNIADGLLNGVEYLVGKQFDNIVDLKNELKQLGLENLKIKTASYTKAGHLKQIQFEMQNFFAFVDNLEIVSLDNVQALPYRRRLSQIEANTVRQNLKQFWNFDGGYWEPLTECSPQPFCFYNVRALDNVDFKNIINILSKTASKSIFEITEDRIDYEIAFNEFDKDGFETIYTDNTNKWMIYISHEGTIAFGGIELVTEMEFILKDKLQFKNQW